MEPRLRVDSRQTDSHSSAWPAEMVEARESETLVSLETGQSQTAAGSRKGQKGQERRPAPVRAWRWRWCWRSMSGGAPFTPCAFLVRVGAAVSCLPFRRSARQFRVRPECAFDFWRALCDRAILAQTLNRQCLSAPRARDILCQETLHQKIR